MMNQPPSWLSTSPPDDRESPLVSAHQWDADELRLITGIRAMGWLAHHLSDATNHTLWIDLEGARALADAILLAGCAVGATPPGHLPSVAAKLASMSITHLVWDARCTDLEVVEAVNSMVTALTDPVQCWAVTSEHVTDRTIVQIDDKDPSPPELLPHDLDVLAWFSPSRRILVDLPVGLQRPDAASGRVRCDVLQQLQQSPRRSMSAIADQVIQHHRDLFGFAVGDDINDVSPSDLFGLQRIAESASDENTACLAGAAAGLMRIRYGQFNEAKTYLNQIFQRTSMADPAHRALLLWADARVDLERGQLGSADAQFAAATQLVDTARELDLLATMHRRWADALAARDFVEHAAQHYRSARALYRRRANPEGVSAALRGSADQAVAMKEILSAEALYDQSDVQTTTSIEHANRLLGWANLAILQGGWDRAQTLLNRANRTGADSPIIAANCSRRKADLALRSGDPISAISYGKKARKQFEGLGIPVAAARCIRLCGDAEAMQGANKNAFRLYRQAIKEHLLCGDQHGYQRTLRHVCALLQSLGESKTAASLWQTASEMRLDVS